MKRSSLVLLVLSSLSPLALAGCQTVEEDGYTYSDTYSRGYDEDYVEQPVYSDRVVVRRPPPVVYDRPAPIYRPQYAAPQPYRPRPQPQYQPPRPPPQYQPPPPQYQPQPHRPPPPPPPPGQPGPHGSDRGQPPSPDPWPKPGGTDIGR